MGKKDQKDKRRKKKGMTKKGKDSWKKVFVGENVLGNIRTYRESFCGSFKFPVLCHTQNKIVRKSE